MRLSEEAVATAKVANKSARRAIFSAVILKPFLLVVSLVISGCVLTPKPLRLPNQPPYDCQAGIRKAPVIAIIYPNQIKNKALQSRSFLNGIANSWKVNIGEDVRTVFTQQASWYFDRVEMLEDRKNLEPGCPVIEVLNLEGTLSADELSISGQLHLLVGHRAGSEERKTIPFNGEGDAMFLMMGGVWASTTILTKSEREAMQQLLDRLAVIFRAVYKEQVTDKPTEAVFQPPATQVRIAVWQLTASVGVEAKAMDPLTESLRDSLLKSGRFQIMARGEMEKVLKEQQISLAVACDTTDCAVEYGQNLSIAKIVVGSVAKVGATYQVMLKIVDVASATEEQTGKARGSGGEETLLDLVDQAAAELVKE